MSLSRFLFVVFGIVLGGMWGADATHAATRGGKTLDAVKLRGVLHCGVNSSLAGFSSPNDRGEMVGIDIDYCKAIAAAVLGDPDRVVYKLLTSKQRFSALQTGEIDVLVRNTTWILSRDVSGMNFGPINYYDGQGFMVRKSLQVGSAMELDGASICVQSGTTTELNLSDYFRAKGMEYRPVVFERVEEVNAAYGAGRCDAYTGDASGLYAARLILSNPDEHVVLPETISKEPMGPVIREGDDLWFDVVSWVHYALITAEELGITQENVRDMRKNSQDLRVQRVLGSGEGNVLGVELGLDVDWVADVVEAVGNYGEIFDRNLGAHSELKISRGLNALWSDGGLQYAPPVR